MNGHRLARLKIWFTGLSLGLPLLSSGQSPTLTFSHLTVEEGLSQSTVYAMAQDSRGFMWFGTRDGLNRYDARTLAMYRHQPNEPGSLSANSINALLADRRGRLWVGTSRGLNLYQPQQDTFLTMLTTDKTKSISSNLITNLLEDRRGQLWIGTRHGLNRLVAENPFRFERYTADPARQQALASPDIRALYEDRDGILWIGTSAGLSRLTQPGKSRHDRQVRLTNFYLEPNDSLYHNNTNWINAIREDRFGRLWLGTEKKGIALFDKKLGRVVSWNATPTLDLSTQTVRTIQPDRNGNFWIGTISGLYIVSQDGRRSTSLTNDPANPYSLSDNSVRSIFHDRSGSSWIGTYYGGVSFYNPLAKPFGQLRPVDERGGMPFKIAGPLLPGANGQLWVGSDDRGLFLVDRNQRILNHYTHRPKDGRSISSDKVKSLLADGKAGLWVGTIKGLNYLNTRTNAFTHYAHEPNNPRSLADDRVYDLKQDTSGTLWVATYRGGLCRFDPKTRTFDRFVHEPGRRNSLSSNSLTQLLIDSRGQFWIGTSGGLNRRLPGQNTFERFVYNPHDPTSLSSNYVICLYEDRHHRLWIGTRDGGLNLLLPGERQFRHFTTAQGLPSNAICSIREDSHGQLWISTANGLTRFDPNRFGCTNYDKYDGLVCKEFNTNSVYQDPGGRLYFGGYNGIAVFHPDSIRSNSQVPRLAFTGLRLFTETVTPRTSESVIDKSIGYTTSLTFNHRQNVFSVEFATLNYINPARNRYAYQLVGFDDWNYVREPVATYMNLTPGTYTLRVKGANNNGVWNTKPLEMSIRVLPPPWKSPGAYVFYSLLFVGLLYLWSRFNRIRMQLSHDLELEHLAAVQQQQLHQTKLNFFTNIAHEIRTPLTLVISPIETLSERYAADSFIQKQLSVMQVSTGRLLRLLNQLLDFQKHETGNVQLQRQEYDLVLFLEKITDSFRNYAQSRQVHVRFESASESLPVCFDADELEKVIYNLLLNAQKFTPAGGDIAVSLCQTDSDTNTVMIRIEDNGVGIPAAELSHVFQQFYQAGQAGSRQAGFGIGLALSKSIIDLHQGTISVESQEAIGSQHGFTRFTITLPLPAQTPSATAPGSLPVPTIPMLTDDWSLPVHSPAAHVSPITGSTDKPLILLVEDQDDIRLYLRDLLSPAYQVIDVADGLAGWERATHLLPDLVISDVAMPLMDGVELTRRLKTDPRTSHIPVILLTAKGAIENQLAGLQTGADDYLTKPFLVSLLMTRIQNLLRLREKLKEKYHRLVTLQPQDQPLDHPDAKFLNRLMTALDANLGDPDFNVTSLVSELGMSRPVLFRKVKMLTGLSVIDLLRTTRLKKAEMLLRQKKMSIAEVAFMVGFNDPKYFSKSFRSQFGKTPTEYLANLN